MTDVHDPATRSFNMSKVRSSGNHSTELKLRTLLRSHHISGWRRGYPLFGKPDFVFPKNRLAVFVDGCFWHGCKRNCRPAPSNNEFWRKKIEANIRRDRLVTRELRKKGWTVLRIWEHELRSQRDAPIRRIMRCLSIDQVSCT